MSRCCNDKDDELVSLRARQGWVLYLALVINGVMFLVEFAGGLLAESTALLGDSLDMLGDASVYAVTLYALSASARTRAGIAMLKGLAMAVFGVCHGHGLAGYRRWHRNSAAVLAFRTAGADTSMGGMA